MTDPHRPLFLDDPEPYGNEWAYRLARAGWDVTETALGCFARKKNKLILPQVVANRVRYALGRAQGWTCAYCPAPIALDYRLDDFPGALELTIDHRVPLALGGTWKRRNLAGACAPCNKAKRDMPEVEYRALLDIFPPEPSGRWRQRVNLAASKAHGARAQVAKLALRHAG